MKPWRVLTVALLAVAVIAASIACEDEAGPDPATEPDPPTGIPTAVTNPPTATPARLAPTETPVPTPTHAPDIITPTPQPDEEVLTILYWQAPTLPFPYQASGTKDRDAGAIILEPLAVIDPDGNLVPRLAVEIPSRENGGITDGGRTITWRLRENLTWSDGSPLTANDVVFTWRYCTTAEIGCFSLNTFERFTSVTAINDREVLMTLDRADPRPELLMAGAGIPIISEAQFADCLAGDPPNCDDEHLMPIGSGPYRVVETIPNERIVYERNPNYWDGRPHFDRVVLIGGGDAESNAQAALVEGTADYAWNLQVTPDQLDAWQEDGVGELVIAFASDVERIVVNQTNPYPINPDDASEYLDGANHHPVLTFTPIRKAMSMAIDRQQIAGELYGTAGVATCNLVTAPSRFVSDRNDECLVQDIEGAKALLDENGIVDSDGDGIREYSGVPLSLTFQTTANAVREGTFALIQGWWAEIGIESTLMTHDASIFFGGDPAEHTESYRRFIADVQMYTTGSGLDPQGYLSTYRCDDIQSRDNLWAEDNNARLCSQAYDWVFSQLEAAGSEMERQAAIRALNDAIVRPAYEIPLVLRGLVSAKANGLHGVRMNAWDSELWNIAEWHR